MAGQDDAADEVHFREANLEGSAETFRTVPNLFDRCTHSIVHVGILDAQCVRRKVIQDVTLLAAWLLLTTCKNLDTRLNQLEKFDGNSVKKNQC